MIVPRVLRLLTLLLMLATLSSCEGFLGLLGVGDDDDGPGNAPLAPPVLGNWSASAYDGHAIVTGSQRVSIDSAYAGRSILYVVTNGGGSARSIQLPVAGNQDGLGAHALDGSAHAGTASDPARPLGVRGIPDMPAPPPLEPVTPWVAPGTSPLRGSSGTAAQPVWSLGDTDRLQSYTQGEVDAEVVAVSHQAPWSVYVWAQRDSSGTPLVESNVAETVAQVFLDPDSERDIHDMITGIVGEPWGDHGYSNLIAGTRRDIHIVLYDIEGDGGPSPATSYIVGYFWPTQNYVSSGNQRLAFYLDRVLLSDTANTVGDGDTDWSATDAWPREAISTLAHEYQHMIHFYQRWVRRGPQTEFPAWLNELMSMAVEDLLARDLAVPGPRGVNAADGSAGGAGNRGGRLPEYIAAASETPLTSWANSLDHYAVSYSFGAYLLRAMGPELLTELMLETDPGSALNYGAEALAMAASSRLGQRVGFDELTRRWAVSMLASDDPGAAPGFRINTGDWIGRAQPGRQVGSINLWNYRAVASVDNVSVVVDGPLLRRTDRGPLALAASAHLFATAGRVPASGVDLQFSLPEDVTVTVLTR